MPFHRMDSSAGLKSIAASHMSQGSGIVGPTHWQRTHRLIEGRVRPNKSEHGLRSSTARRSTSTQMQRHEPSRETLAAFACGQNARPWPTVTERLWEIGDIVGVLKAGDAAQVRLV